MFDLKRHQQALKKRLGRFHLPHGHTITDDTQENNNTSSSMPEISPVTTATITTAQIDEPLHRVSTVNSSMIFERSVMSPVSRAQSFSSCKSIPHLSQEIYVPSVLDATATVDDGEMYQIICGSSGHPLCKRRHSSVSMCPLYHDIDELDVVVSDDEGESQAQVDYSDNTKLNFCSFADLMSDEETERDRTVSPVLTRKNSMVVVPLSLKP